jgi:double-stranded uracil-DNA glycosylase
MKPADPNGALATLPDLLRDGLDVVFVGINPSIFSATQGHYFARRTNRFWPCFSRSSLSRAARRAIGLGYLQPMHDRVLLENGFGFTDLVKRPTAKASDLTFAELASGVARLVEKLELHKPRIACFHGVTAYRPIHRSLTSATTGPSLGLQSISIGRTRLFLVPNPSSANAHFTPAEQTDWYDRLGECLAKATG